MAKRFSEFFGNPYFVAEGVTATDTIQMFSLDFLTIGILFGILALLGYLVYAIRGVLAERVAEETVRCFHGC